jgi:hypothetical protein
VIASLGGIFTRKSADLVKSERPLIFQDASGAMHHPRVRAFRGGLHSLLKGKKNGFRNELIVLRGLI